MIKTVFVFLVLIFVSCTSNKYTAMNLKEAKIFLNKNQNKEWFIENYNDYEPDEEQIKRWEKHHDKKLIIFAGAWCEDTHFLLPRFYKCIEMLDDKKPDIEIIWVNREKKSETKLEEKYKIDRIPTFIILKDGVEINRVVEVVKFSIEKDIADAFEIKN